MQRVWRDMATTDFANGTSDWIAVLPLAAIEQHGPHLPLGVDSMIAEAMVTRCIEALPPSSKATFLPVQQIGKSNEHINFTGTLSLNWETAIKAWIELGESVARTGVKKLLLITSHGGNNSCMDIVARELRENHSMQVVTTSWEKLGDRATMFDHQKGIKTDIHGGAIETSIMLALHPELVDLSKAKDFDSNQQALKKNFRHLGYHSSNATVSWLAEDLNPAGVVGKAALVSAQAGEALIASEVEGFCRLIEEIEAFGS